MTHVRESWTRGCRSNESPQGSGQHCPAPRQSAAASTAVSSQQSAVSSTVPRRRGRVEDDRVGGRVGCSSTTGGAELVHDDGEAARFCVDQRAYDASIRGDSQIVYDASIRVDSQVDSRS